MSDALELHLCFLSDWHVGEGAGARGQVDAIVRRHPGDDLPYVPAKTLTGILRDGCERVVYGLDRGDPKGHWHGLLREVFGSSQEDKADRRARAARLSIGPARLNAALRGAIRDDPIMRDALVLLKPGVKLDAYGVAQSQMLRFEEVVLAGAELTAPLALNLAVERREHALTLIAAGARAVERLGAKRRRGTGRCTLSLVGGLSEYRVVAILGQMPKAGGDEPTTSGPVLALDSDLAARSDDWLVIALDLDLDSPVIVPAQTLGNVVTTQDHIPGSLLLPALDPWIRGLLGAGTTRALASGAVQLRNAYPAATRSRLLPVPASVFKLKEGEDYTNHLPGEPEGKQQRKQLRAGFVSRNGLATGQTGGVIKVGTTAATHATIEDAVQRPTSAVGGVFTYQAIRPGQRLVAELWIDKGLLDADLNLTGWLAQAPKALRIGRAKKDDYGRVSLTARESAPVIPATDPERLTVWLASPLLLRDNALAPVMDAAGLADALGKALDVRLAVPDGEHRPVFLRPWRDDGWNNAWQMRRATRFGIAPGSCVSFHSSRQLSAAELARVQDRGLGERRGEGYGELVFNPPLLSDREVPSESLNPDRPDDASPGDLVPSAFSRALQRRAVRLLIQRRALARDKAFRDGIGWRSGASPIPPNTQLGALRARMESLQDSAGLERIRAWLTAVDQTEKRSGKWPQASKERLATHLDDDSPGAIWENLGLEGGPPVLPGHDAAALAEELRVEAIKTLWLTAISRQLNQNNRSPMGRQEQEEARNGS